MGDDEDDDAREKYSGTFVDLHRDTTTIGAVRRNICCMFAPIRFKVLEI